MVKSKYYKYIAVIFWLFIWQAASFAVGESLRLASPLDSLIALFKMLGTGRFWAAAGGSFMRITLGFLIALAVGILLAVLAYCSRLIRELVTPLIKIIKAVPIASFIILALLWIQSSTMPLLISFLMVLPVIYINVLQGIESADQKQLEMAKVFRLDYLRKLRYIYMPSVAPYFISACSVGLGLCWKSGVAAEVIGLSPDSIGRQLYDAKLYLLTQELFAWTAVIVLISAGFEKLVMFGVRKAYKRLIDGSPKPGIKTENPKQGSLAAGSSPGISLCGITKTYHGTTVLNHLDMKLQPSKLTCLMGPSGRGKTTVLNLILGLQDPDEGTITGMDGTVMSVVFQEDRLCELFNSTENVRLVNKCLTTEEIRKEFKAVGLVDHEDKPVSLLSGGMKRRVSIVRAMMAESNFLLLDEPFQGLDEALKEQVIQYVKERSKGKTTLMITHDPREAEIMESEVIVMK